MRKGIAIMLTAAAIVCGAAVTSMLLGGLSRAIAVDHPSAAQIELDGLMRQVESGELDLDALSDSQYIVVVGNVNRLVDQVGTITEASHYFRNAFSRAPDTLGEMKALIRYEQGGTFGWKQMSRGETRLHMFGKDGKYNTKFISADGHLEAVYNREGVKLTEANDPLNMGTFNYADPVSEKLKHTVYDVLPFFEWGNSVALASPVADRDVYSMNGEG